MTRRRSDGSGTGKDEPGDLTDMERALLAEGRRRITVRDGDEAREMSMNEIVTRKTAETAIKGSPHAQRTWFQVHAAAEARAAAIREKGAEFWRMYQRYWRKQIAEAEAQGEAPPDPIPHPDDVCIDHRNGVTIDGPVTREEARVYARIADEREAYLRQHVLDQRLRRNETLLERERGFGSALPMAFLSNPVLPQRLRLDDAGMSRLMSPYPDLEKINSRSSRMYASSSTARIFIGVLRSPVSDVSADVPWPLDSGGAKR